MALRASLARVNELRCPVAAAHKKGSAQRTHIGLTFSASPSFSPSSFLRRGTRSADPTLARQLQRHTLTVRGLAAPAGPGFGSASVEEASELLGTGEYTYLDVRTEEEFSSGHVQGSVNIPIMNAGPGGMVLIPDFVDKVKEKFPTDAALLVGCKSGMRSRRAASELAAGGFTNTIDVEGGFMSWVEKGLPFTR